MKEHERFIVTNVVFNIIIEFSIKVNSHLKITFYTMGIKDHVLLCLSNNALNKDVTDIFDTSIFYTICFFSSAS